MSVAPGRSLVDIAASLGKPITYVEAILQDEQKRGNVEHVDGQWRLTASARQQFGAALRHVGPYAEDRW